MKCVLVTGATGLLGAYVVSRLLKQGALVRGLARSPSARRAVEALGAEAVPGELSQVESLVAAAGLRHDRPRGRGHRDGPAGGAGPPGGTSRAPLT